MGQFPITPDREKILTRIPDYAVTITPYSGRVIIRHHGRVLADSSRAMRIDETKHSPVYYLPRDDVRMELLEPTELSTYCPFKGHASYWSLRLGDQLEENVVWSYESPFPEVEGLKSYLAFYGDRTELELQDR